MKEFPDLKYAASSSAFFGLVKEADPEMLEEIKERIKEGRFEIVGGWLIEPDCNMPSAEGFARQSLIGQRMLDSLLGVKASVGYCPDSFGHAATIPKILRESEMDSYVFMRPKPHEMELPSSIFRWKADDGSEVTTYRILLNYGLTKLLYGLERIELNNSEAQRTGIPHMAIVGVSNHGGGPTNEFLSAIKEQNYDFAEFSTVREYFDTVKKLDLLPTVTGELQHHAIGCYSANTEFKKMLAECEHRLTETESISLMSSRIAGFEYPKEKLREAWGILLFNHFHDLLGGCSVKGVYKTAMNQLGAVDSICDKIVYGAMQKIAQSIDTVCNEVYKKAPERWFVWEAENHGMPIVVCNSKPYPVKTTIKMFISASKITDSRGNDVPFQKVRGEQTLKGRKDVIALSVDLKPYSYEVYRVYQLKDPEREFDKIICDRDRLENDKLTVTFDKHSGEIASIYDKVKDRYIADKTFGTRILDETASDTWAHNRDTLGDDIGSFCNAEFSVIESGPALSTLRVKQKYGTSTLTRDYTLVVGSDVLSVKASVELYEKHRSVKICIPAKDSVTAAIPFGTVCRSKENMEEPFGEWLSSGNIGFAAPGLHGYDLSGGYFCPTLLRSAIYADHFAPDGENVRDERCEYMGLGRTDISYALFPTDSKTETRIKCDLFGTPPRAVYSSFHKGTLPERMSLFESDKPVLISSIKMAEDSSKAVVRLFDLEGDERDVNISLFDSKISPRLKAHSVNTVSEDGRELYFTENEK
jgi:alpha-mannosidase